MRDSGLEAKLELADEAYKDLVRTRASLGSSALAEAIRRGRDLGVRAADGRFALLYSEGGP